MILRLLFFWGWGENMFPKSIPTMSSRLTAWCWQQLAWGRHRRERCEELGTTTKVGLPMDNTQSFGTRAPLPEALFLVVSVVIDALCWLEVYLYMMFCCSLAEAGIILKRPRCLPPKKSSLHFYHVELHVRFWLRPPSFSWILWCHVYQLAGGDVLHYCNSASLQTFGPLGRITIPAP